MSRIVLIGSSFFSKKEAKMIATPRSFHNSLSPPVGPFLQVSPCSSVVVLENADRVPERLEHKRWVRKMMFRLNSG